MCNPLQLLLWWPAYCLQAWATGSAHALNLAHALTHNSTSPRATHRVGSPLLTLHVQTLRLRPDLNPGGCASKTQLYLVSQR